MLKPLPQLLMDMQAETIRRAELKKACEDAFRTECWACGKELKYHEVREEPLRHPGTGEVEAVEICQRCKDLDVLEKWR